MKTDMVRPCDECPFSYNLKSVPLLSGRIRGIAKHLLSDGSFSCHKTTSSDDCEAIITRDAQFCAGAMILMEKLERPTQFMRFAERLGLYKPDQLDMSSPVVDSVEELYAKHDGHPINNWAAVGPRLSQGHDEDVPSL